MSDPPREAPTYAHPPECNCYPGGFSPASYEGPKEDCPEHGRPYTEWVQRALAALALADTLDRQATDAEARAERAEAAIERVCAALGDHDEIPTREIRAALWPPNGGAP